jgi:hypothetical protein
MGESERPIVIVGPDGTRYRLVPEDEAPGPTVAPVGTRPHEPELPPPPPIEVMVRFPEEARNLVDVLLRRKRLG